jgi:hypothetical protein
MPKKRVILIHGRAIKPADAAMELLATEAVLEGLKRAKATSTATQLSDGLILFDLVYFGDIINKIQAAARKNDAALLTEQDPDHGNAKCFPIAELREAFDNVKTIKSFSEAQYHNVLRTSDDWRFLDEAADFANLIGSLFTFGWLNEAMIRSATPDLAAYLTEHTIASSIRERFNAILVPALTNGDDVCLIAHSMGCMVSYDEFWKYSHTSEYAQSLVNGKAVSCFITLGCPLGETGVRRNLLDGRYQNEADKYPRNQIKDWWNIVAKDDYIARSESMRAAFSEMRTKKYVNSIKDRNIYNCWSYVNKSNNHKVSNPHDLYGYLIHPTVGSIIANWAA